MLTGSDFVFEVFLIRFWLFRDKILSHPHSYAGRRLCHAVHGPACADQRVTWPQFVDHVIARPAETYDSHWYAVSAQCGHCVLEYDLVIMMEKIEDDWPLVSRMSGVILPPLPLMNSGDSLHQGRYASFNFIYQNQAFSGFRKLWRIHSPIVRGKFESNIQEIWNGFWAFRI